MGVYVEFGSLFTLLVIAIWYFQRELKFFIGQRKLKKNIIDKDIEIKYNDFTTLDLEVLEPMYRIPRGQWVHFCYDIPSAQEATRKRKYVGNSLSSIKLPFVNLSLQNKEFRDDTEFEDRGPFRLTLTNKLLRAEAINSDKSVKREYKWANIEQVRFVKNNLTVQINVVKNAWPIRFSFNKQKDAIEFCNAIWTLVDKYSKIDLNSVGKMPDNFVKDIYDDEPEFDKEFELKRLKKGQLASIAFEYYDKESLTNYLKSDFVDLLLVNDLESISEEDIVNASNNQKLVVTIDEETGVKSTELRFIDNKGEVVY